MTTTAKEWTDELTNKGVLVLEGVAGIGKTHSIRSAREHIYGGHVLSLSVVDWWKELCSLLNEGCLTAQEVSTGIQNSPCDYGREALIGKIQALGDVETFKYVMHPSTSYEEFIGGTRPTAGPSVHFKWQQGVFLRFLDSAISNPGTPHLFVMDEINRCNLPSVLGELLYLIEPSRRVRLRERPRDGKEAAQLLMQCEAIRIGPDGHPRNDATATFQNIYWIPDNFFILGTMNSSDRSILGFDQALRRRFPPHRLEPFSGERFEEYLQENDDKASTSDAKEIFLSATKQFASLNALLRFLIGPDAMVGHSYLLQALDQADYKQQKAAGVGFASVDPGVLRKRIAAAWRYGILPQVVHAAESVRQEDSAVLLCGELRLCPTLGVCSTKLEKTPWKDRCQAVLQTDAEEGDEKSHALLAGRYIEALTSAGLAEEAKQYEQDTDVKNKLMKSFTRVLGVAAVDSWNLEPKVTAKIDLVGQGHGQRLLIV